MNEKKLIGQCGVDAGLLMIGDPCYFWGHTEGEKTTGQKSLPIWTDVCSLLGSGPGKDSGQQLLFEKGHTGLGVIVETTHGDGLYPVYIETDEGGNRRIIVELE